MQIVSFGREGFVLGGNELADFVRQCLGALFAKGAKPVVGATDKVHYWMLANYGEAPEEMTVQ